MARRLIGSFEFSSDLPIEEIGAGMARQQAEILKRKGEDAESRVPKRLEGQQDGPDIVCLPRDCGCVETDGPCKVHQRQPRQDAATSEGQEAGPAKEKGSQENC